MSVYLISVRGGRKVALPVLTEESYRRLRNTSSQQANLRQARMGNQAAKRRLIQFNYSGYYPDGVVKGCRLPSQAFGFDVDDAGEFERIAKMLMEKRGPAMESQGTGARRGTAGSEIKGAAAEGGDAGEGKGADGTAGEGATLAERLGLLMLERSASQGGHAVFKRERGKTILENQVRIAKALDCELDTNAHDINRVYFSSTADKDELLFLSPELFNDQYGVSPGADVDRVAEEARTLEDREKNGKEELPEGAHGSNTGFRAGFCFSAGATDLVFSASLPAAAKTWMIIPLGIAAFVVFYAVFYFAITKFDLKTPGREDEDEESEKKVVLANNNYTEVASAVLAAVGGKENVKDVGYCATRLRFEVKDNSKVDEKAVKAAGAAGVIRPSKTACQVIIGTKVQFVYDEL